MLSFESLLEKGQVDSKKKNGGKHRKGQAQSGGERGEFMNFGEGTSENPKRGEIAEGNDGRGKWGEKSPRSCCWEKRKKLLSMAENLPKRRNKSFFFQEGK